MYMYISCSFSVFSEKQILYIYIYIIHVDLLYNSTDCRDSILARDELSSFHEFVNTRIKFV